MLSFAHLGKNVDAAELGGFEDVILDACCQNIAADDAVWDCVVEASITLMSLTQKSNPRSLWCVDLFPSHFILMV
jgi:TELO2-interacting protein 2